MPKNISSTEDELLIRLGNDDEFALAQLMNTYQNRVYTAAMRVVKSREVAEEIVQDVFIAVWNKRAMLATVENFPAYVYGIAKHMIYHALKKIIRQRTQQTAIGQEKEAWLFYQDTEDWLQTKEFHCVLKKAVDGLPERQKQTFLLIKEEGYTRNKAAESMNVSSETVKSNLDDAIKKVKNYLLRHPKILLLLFVLPLR